MKKRQPKSLKQLFSLWDGPLAGFYVALTTESGSSTGYIEVRGECGRYKSIGNHRSHVAAWEPMEEAA